MGMTGQIEGPVSAGRSADPLRLDTTIDSKIEFTACSVLPQIAAAASAKTDSSDDKRREKEAQPSTYRAAPLPTVAGSKEWLPMLVAAGREEATIRESVTAGEADAAEDEAPNVFFAVDVECVLHKLRRWHQCFQGVKPFYAVKCNPSPAVISALAMVTQGCAFDCASPAEMDQVLSCGVSPSRIIYANPCKDLAALEHALSAGIVTMTFDSGDELRKIRRVLDARAEPMPLSPLPNDAKIELVLRLRVPDAHSDCPLGEKYGAAEEDCRDLIRLARDLRLPLVGVSFHCGSGCQDAQAYPAALTVARKVFDIAADEGCRLTLLDIGGGFPGWDGSEYVYEEAQNGNETSNGGTDCGRVATPQAPLSLEAVAAATLPVLYELFPPSSGVQVIAEPGRYLVEASHVLFARIYAKREIALQGSNEADANAHPLRKTTAYFIDEGVDGCFKDSVLFGFYFEPCPVSPRGRRRCRRTSKYGDEDLSANATLEHTDGANGGGEASDDKRGDQVEEDEGEEEEEAIVMGPSGSPTDIVARKRLPRSLAAGDWLYFSRMGAYTSSIASVASSAALETAHFYVASSPPGAITRGDD